MKLLAVVLLAKIDYRDLVFSHWCCWRYNCPGMWCSDIGSYTFNDTVLCGKKL